MVHRVRFLHPISVPKHLLWNHVQGRNSSLVSCSAFYQWFYEDQQTPRTLRSRCWCMKRNLWPATEFTGFGYFHPPQPCFYCPLLTTLQWLPITVFHMDWWFQSNLLGLALQRYQVDHCWSRVMAHRSVFSSCSLFGICLKVFHNKRLEGEKKKIDSTTQAIWLLSVPRTYSSLSFPVSGMFSI